MWNVDYPIVDLHTHIIPWYDDGPNTYEESLKMIDMEYDQGIRHVFCTSHNGYTPEDIKDYLGKFHLLQRMVKSKYPDMELHTGTEILCAGMYIDDIVYGLENGAFLPLAKTRYVLVELFGNVTIDEANKVISTLQANNWHPVLAHAERYPALFEGAFISELISRGCLIQVNAHSLVNDTNEERKSRARWLLKNGLMHFIGSDSHNLDPRVPNISSVIDYLHAMVEPEYIKKILFENYINYLS